MPLQYNEYYNEQTGLTIGLKKLLFSEQSEYQLVEVYETDTWGNLMTIDGMVMLSERDEFVYHEMISHTAMFTHPNPQRVLIIGGGDGGTAREVLKHQSVVHVDMVEIDKTVVDASKLHFPEVGDFENPKLNVLYEDGIAFVKSVKDPYDVIIIDGSDPVGPAEGLFEKDFYQYCLNALSDEGVLTAQTESPWVESYHPSMKKVFNALDDLFPISKMYLNFIPLYPAGMWSMACASRGDDPLSDETIKRIENGIKNLGGLRYYNSDIHRGAFALPTFVSDLIRR
ncbi:polyamine aminopropyltransferase [Rhodohalobacter sp. SW132]|uniref:polyamine aminopropyltransferase n=1 Tax=Rhodohalobacter sp. SW132 TaxID=2293433 RepID=UPI000E2890F3|nr:polyamine aminopropyltransferase [Rhodohalobacter sp. SW132]REL37572.1 polyamine aminopropyltransferase [Rhodohalobacter sp. SW132]